MSWPEQNTKERKDFEFKIESIDEDGSEGIVEAYASTFENIDLDFDRIKSGAFSKSIQENENFPILADHNPSKPIGINEMAKEDDHGLKIKAVFDIKNNQLAKERFSFIKLAHKMKTFANFSIGFFTIKAEPDAENPLIRNIMEVKLFETSHVVFPANTLANSLSAKFLDSNFDGQDIASSVVRFIEEMKKAGMTDEIVFKAIDSYRKQTAKPGNGPSDLAHLFTKHGQIF